MASLGTDGDVRLWDPATWSPIGLPVTEENVPGLPVRHAGTLRAWFEGGSLGRPAGSVTSPSIPRVGRPRVRPRRAAAERRTSGT